MPATPEPLHRAPGADDASTTPDLTAREARILEFERQWWRHVGAKEQAIREVFGLTAARYYQLLNVVMDSPAAVRQDPMLVKRLQRARDARTAARATRTFTSSSSGDSGVDARPNETIE